MITRNRRVGTGTRPVTDIAGAVVVVIRTGRTGREVTVGTNTGAGITRITRTDIIIITVAVLGTAAAGSIGSARIGTGGRGIGGGAAVLA